MLSSNEFRAGTFIEYRDSIWEIIETQHIKPGKGAAFVQTRLKNVVTGAVLRVNFRAGERVPRAIVESIQMTFTYRMGAICVLMNPLTGDSIESASELFGSNADLVKEGLGSLTVLCCHERVLRVDLPTNVDLEVTSAAPGERGDTANSSTKPAMVETGATIMVPFHIGTGDTIRVDTRTREYIGRVG